MQTCNDFKEFILRKHFDFAEIQQDLSDRWTEDEYNCYIAEQALEIAFDIYPDTDDSNKDMDNRHTFVSEFMEYVRSATTKQWARNMGMITIEEANKRANDQAAEASKFWKKRIELQAKNFREMSCYRFGQWKLDYDNVKEYRDDVTDYMPQDSEDEAWEQLMVFQERNFGKC